MPPLTRALLVTMSKLAEQIEPAAAEKMPPHPLLTSAKMLGSFGAGAGAGFLLSDGSDALVKHYTGKPLLSGKLDILRAVTPLAVGAGTMIYNTAQHHWMEKLRDDIATRRRLREQQGP